MTDTEVTRRQMQTYDHKERDADLRAIIAAVGRSRSMSVEVIRGRSRMADHVSARVEVCVIARNAGFSLHEIGRAIQKDHSTVIHLLKKAPEVKVAASIEQLPVRATVAEKRDGATITIQLSAEETQKLFRLSAERREAATRMVSDSIHYLIADDLFAAILDR
jgi:DNA-binding transcriptional MerR regulator